MSASSKKKLRSQDSGKLTEKQLAERKQNKEIKMYTVAFTAVIVVLLVVAIAVGATQLVSNSGIRERKTVAYTVGEHELNAADFNYFFTDSVNQFLNQYGPYAAMFGLDTGKPLDQQYVDEEQTRTWADDFISQAKDSAKAVYTLADAAKAAGHTLSEEEQADLNNAVTNVDLYAKMQGFGSAKAYLKAMYGNGATLESYRSYLETSMLADSYRNAYAKTLDYEDAELREAEKDKYDQYSSFDYAQYYLPVSQFIKGGTTDEEGNVTFTEEEKAAAVTAAEEAAKTLTADTVKTAADLDKAIKGLELNNGEGAVSTPHVHSDYRTIGANDAEWLADSSRKAGDTTYIASTSTSEDENGESVTTVNGYTVLLFEGRDDNTSLLPNVRHILVSYEGGTADEQGNMTFTDEEKAAAMTKAEELLKQFEAGEQTEDAFAALATENTTDPGSKENGGLYENVYMGQMVPTFNDWVFADGRKAGDTGIVESDYGCHVMYYCGEGDTSYRDLLLKSELLDAEMEQWFADLMEAAVTADGDTSYVRTDLVLGGR